MDILKNALGQQEVKKEEPKEEGFMDKLNSMAGGGRKAEEQEDTLDKGVNCIYTVTQRTIPYR